jgi:hypothetical protein
MTGASPGAIAVLQKDAAGVAATLGSPEWAANLVARPGAVSGFIESLRPQSVFYRFAPLATPFPFFLPSVAMTMLPLDGSTEEGAPLKVIAGTVDPYRLTPRKTGGAVIASREILEATDGAAFGLLRRELQRVVVSAVDAAFLAVVEADVTPTEIDLADLLGDMRLALDAVAQTGGERLVWFVGARAANYLATARDTAGARLFPTMSPAGGTEVGEVSVETHALLARTR